MSEGGEGPRRAKKKATPRRTELRAGLSGAAGWDLLCGIDH